MKINEITENRNLDPSGLIAAAQLVKDFIVTAEIDGVVKKFLVRGMTGPNAARERFLKHHSNAKVLDINEEGVAEGAAADIDKMFNNMYDPVYTNLQRVALLAMQGRQQEAHGQLMSVVKGSSPQVQKKIIDAVNSIKPVTINGKIADSSTLDKSKPHQDWILNTFIPWVQSLLGKQGVAEGGAETSWSDGNEKITLQDILELTKHIKQINLPINDNLKNKLIHWDGNPEEIERINQVTVSNQFPILVMVDEQGQIDWILDGNHRLHKAIKSQAKTIPAKLIKPSDLSDKAKRVFHIKEQGVAEEQVPMFTPEEEQLDEKKDACYSKVKSRYKVWPSAYASGALVQCRKKGAKNWGKKKANESEYDEDDENFNIGDQVKLKPEYEDKPGEIFTITSSNGKKFWIADEDGRGWYVRPYQITHVNDDHY